MRVHLPEALSQAMEGAAADFKLAVNVVREKGLRYFRRPILVGVAMIWACYAWVYKPPEIKNEMLDSQIETLRAVARYADEYKTLSDVISSEEKELAPLSGKGKWLSKAVLTSLQEKGLTADSLAPEGNSVYDDPQAKSDIVIDAARVSLTAKFWRLAPWLDDVESKKPMLHVSQFKLKKLGKPLGLNSIECVIETAMAPGGLAQEKRKGP